MNSPILVYILKDKDNYTAYTNAEPLFCFTRATLEELGNLIAETLNSYELLRRGSNGQPNSSGS